MTYEFCKIGDRVHHLLTKQNGIIKLVFRGQVYVVYNCNNDWENYTNYTGENTSPENLGRGWL